MTVRGPRLVIAEQPDVLIRSDQLKTVTGCAVLAEPALFSPDGPDGPPAHRAP